MSAGILSLGKNHIRSPLEVHFVANTPPPLSLNTEPPLPAGPSIPQPSFALPALQLGLKILGCNGDGAIMMAVVVDEDS